MAKTPHGKPGFEGKKFDYFKFLDQQLNIQHPKATTSTNKPGTKRKSSWSKKPLEKQKTEIDDYAQFNPHKVSVFQYLDQNNIDDIEAKVQLAYKRTNLNPASALS